METLVINCGYETVVRLALGNLFYVFSWKRRRAKLAMEGVGKADSDERRGVWSLLDMIR